MSRQLKVFGWTDMRKGRQTREVMAATSRASVCSVLGRSSRWGTNWMSETLNAEEVAVAMAEPGEIFVRPLGRHCVPFVRIDRFEVERPA